MAKDVLNLYIQGLNQHLFIDISKYNFKDISLHSSEIDNITIALRKELEKVLHRKDLSIDHVYGSDNDDVGKIVAEISYDFNDELLTTFVFKQVSLDSSFFIVQKDEY